MKTITSARQIVLSLAIALLGLATVTAQTVPPLRILPFGDSITEGYVNSSNTIEGGYRTELYSLLTNGGFNVDFVGSLSDVQLQFPDGNHEGHGGKLIQELEAGIVTWSHAYADPDVVLLHVGTTNFWVGESVATVQGRLQSLLTEITTRWPYAEVIVASLIPRMDSYAQIQIAYNGTLPQLVSEQVAMGRNVSFLDMFSALGEADLAADGVHPTIAGYAKMAPRWLTGIQAVATPYGTMDPPALRQVAAGSDLSHVQVTFSKPVRDEDMLPGNFLLNGGVSVVEVSLDAATKRVATLTTTTQAVSTLYTLGVENVRDRSPEMRVIAVGTSATFTSFGPFVNGGFELGEPADYGTLDGWSLSGTTLPVGFTSTEPGFSPSFSPSEGLRMAVCSNGNNDFSGALSQSFATVAGTSYIVELEMGIVSGLAGRKQRMQVDVLGASALVSRQEEITAPGLYSHWMPRSYSFTADSESTTLTLSDASETLTSAQSKDTDLLLDHVRVSRGVSLMVSSAPINVQIGSTPVDADGHGGGNTQFVRHYHLGTQVTLTAPAEVGTYVFSGWQESGEVYSLASSITVTLDANRAFTAIYSLRSTPLVNPDEYSGYRDAQLVVPAPGVLANDEDPLGAPLAAVLDTNVSHGTLTLNPNGSFTYVPSSGYSGSDSFTYHATNGTTASTSVTVAIEVYSVGELVNGGFEDGSPADFGLLSGWTLSGHAGDPVGFTSTAEGFTPVFTPAEGTRMAVFSNGSNQFNGGISQVVATTAGQSYVLSFDLGIVAGAADRKQRMLTQVVGNSTLIQASDEIVAAGAYSYWRPMTYTFVADSAATTISFSDQSSTLALDDARDTDMLLDHVRIVPAQGYYGWSSANGLPADPTLDSDSDGVCNAVEYVVGGVPNGRNDVALLPDCEIVSADPDGDNLDSDYLVFTYRRTDISHGDPTVGIGVEWNTQLGGTWGVAENTAQVVVLEQTDGGGAGVDLVDVYLPRSLAVNGKLFARLRVVVSP